MGSQVMFWGGADDGVAFEIDDADALRGEDGEFAIGEEENFARVVQQGGDIAGDEKLVIA